ncbi:MAG: SpoIIIAH-like family protein [Clostridia bacterium]|nr:SpoIIIAH-like family protein [Clostridia bacterium]
MIILIRLRNLAIFALAVLSVSFIYIGYTGFGQGENEFIPALNSAEEELEFKDDNALLSQDYQIPMENLNIQISSDEVKATANFFAEFRIKRDQARAAQIELLKENINNPRSTQETVNKAQDMIYTLSDVMAKEAHAENLLKSKGYEDSAVFIEGENITVFVKKGQLNEEDIARIGDLVVRATGCSLEQVVITPKE